MAFEAFLKLGDIVGDSTDTRHKGEIMIDAYSFGVENSSSVGSGSGGAGAGKASFSDLSLTTTVSAASPYIMLACASGRHFPEAVLTLRKSGGKASQEFFRVTLSQVLVSSYQDSGSVSDATPVESVGLAFGAIKVEFMSQTPSKGQGPTSSAGWDRVKNEPAKG